ncbi:hypothetical protein G4B88_030006 [Cannabis sativa]|uniref:Uncharacterized protein n=1 Tax=Cannabis sativa TaxID=3483 RepID=A0A7J6GAR1_CANSA|nr:hypothetical protein G4B88_030006 [Cannabis sativa]
MKVMKAHQTTKALKRKAAKGRKKSNDKSIKRGVAQVSKAIAIPKSLESIQTKSTKSSCIHIGTTKVKQQGLTQIMIGSVPIHLVDVSFCMVNSTEEEANGLDFSVQKTTKDPTSSLCTKLLNSSTTGSYTKYAGAKPVISRKPFKVNIEGIESNLVRNISLFQGNPTKGFTSKPKSTRYDASTGFNFSQLNSYTFSNGINEWTSKEKEEGRWECLHGLNTIRTTTAITGALRNKPKQYMRQVVCSKLHPVRKCLAYKCPSFLAVQSKSFIKCSSDSYRNVPSTNHEKTFPRKSVRCNNIESNSMSVFIIGTMSLEEQIEELQRKLAEKDAEVEYLTTQLAKQASLSKQKQVEQGQYHRSHTHSTTKFRALKNIIEKMVQHEEI